jgi:hypothetical protein
MPHDYQTTSLWKKAFTHQNDGLNDQRDFLKQNYFQFRERTTHLLAFIAKELPDLTSHDITHIDKLWDVASEIAGADYELNPAEAFVLGGAFLLHDAAHSRIAFKGGLAEIENTPEWIAAKARLCKTGTKLVEGSAEFQSVLFESLRNLHPQQAKHLPNIAWRVDASKPEMYLIENEDLRSAYGNAIGEIANSHWWNPVQLETLRDRKLTAHVCIQPAKWGIDFLKVAALLRTADAAHLDAERAPKFLMALTQPNAHSKVHWQFQSKLNQVECDLEKQSLRITSGEPFTADEKDAWWLAFDTCQMIDKELNAVDRILRDCGRIRFAARCVEGAHSPERFALNVPTLGWEPVDASIKITDIHNTVTQFGGEKLYGDDPKMALRELLQNARDAVVACRAMGGLGEEEGEIEVALEKRGKDTWLHVTDTGIGMSQYVLTQVLLDFGKSLWRSPQLGTEWQSLEGTDFEAVGQFGIGFFSVFMLGDEVVVTTKRWQAKAGESADLELVFESLSSKRPIVRKPKKPLPRNGTKIAIKVSEDKLKHLFDPNIGPKSINLLCQYLAPTLRIDLYCQEINSNRILSIKANDWLKISKKELFSRIYLNKKINQVAETNFDKGENSLFSEMGSISDRLYLSSAFYSNFVCTIGGIRAGLSEGFEGIAEGAYQIDLARKNINPTIEINYLKKCALNYISKNIKIDFAQSARLLEFLDDHNNLKIAYAHNEDGDEIELNYFELVDFIKFNNLNKILINFGFFCWEEDDECKRNEFNTHFAANADVIILNDINTSTYNSRSYYRERLIKYIKAAFSAAFSMLSDEEFAIDESSCEEVGQVWGNSIYRNCYLITKLN